ncbi:MAG: hypothetical protein EAZ62_01170 [Sphingobacteriia bacterium]|nr:MAG: hypothetical protein EAZ62_01170 [Sphingobacteriia bacterium]
MEFSQLVGQEQTVHRLIEMVKQNRLGHALLFLGKEGSGALPLALSFAQYLVSFSPDAPLVEDLFGGMSALEPTGGFKSPAEIYTTSAYQRAAQLQHPDLHFSYPVIPKKSGDKPTSSDYAAEWRDFIKTYPYGNVYDWIQSLNAENKQGNITAEECKRIFHEMSLKAFESKYKILLMWMPEYLAKEGNKLLKILEEPPPNTVFLLVAESEEQILPTILSRCQIIRVPLPDDADIQKSLVEKAGADPATAQRVAVMAEGNYREALQMLQHAEEDWQELLKEWLNASLKTGPQAQLKLIEELARLGREKQKQFLRYFNHLLETSIRLRVLGDKAPVVPAAEADFAARLNKISSVSQQEAIIKELDKAAYYIERNAHAKMLFLSLTIRLRHIIQHKSLILED